MSRGLFPFFYLAREGPKSDSERVSLPFSRTVLIGRPLYHGSFLVRGRGRGEEGLLQADYFTDRMEWILRTGTALTKGLELQ